jgi:hypothetical protein
MIDANPPYLSVASRLQFHDAILSGVKVKEFRTASLLQNWGCSPHQQFRLTRFSKIAWSSHACRLQKGPQGCLVYSDGGVNRGARLNSAFLLAFLAYAPRKQMPYMWTLNSPSIFLTSRRSTALRVLNRARLPLAMKTSRPSWMIIFSNLPGSLSIYQASCRASASASCHSYARISYHARPIRQRNAVSVDVPRPLRTDPEVSGIQAKTTIPPWHDFRSRPQFSNADQIACHYITSAHTHLGSFL